VSSAELLELIWANSSILATEVAEEADEVAMDLRIS
jgi:hypothetical protein